MLLYVVNNSINYTTHCIFSRLTRGYYAICKEQNFKYTAWRAAA